MLCILDYTNYRKFIKDYYEFQKIQKSTFSYQYFAIKAGFKSKASLANITSGKQALAKNKIYDVGRAMKLGKKEMDYFSALVYFNDAKSVEERKSNFEKMQSLTVRYNKPRIIDSQYEYYSKWYHCVIRELVTIIDFKDDYKILANMVEPPITPKMARMSVELLLKLGMIKKAPNGLYLQIDKMLSSGEEVTSLALQKYHKEHLTLAADSIDRFDRSLREVSSVTAGLSRAGFAKIIKEAAQFRKNVLEIVEHDTPVETVYQIALQIYPISKMPKNWRS
jgi:uncharacterized protein (TIGR02147 family)